MAQAPLQLSLDEGDVDLRARKLHFTLNAVATRVELNIHSPDGELLHRAHKSFGHLPARSPLTLEWPDLGARGQNFLLELKVTDPQGRWVSFEVVRFYFEVPHEEVVFDSGRWTFSQAEQAKLDKPLQVLTTAVTRYASLVTVQLYVAGHTDTQGSRRDNQRLSEQRARAIAQYFHQHGLQQVPVFVRGFGEERLAVPTQDNVAEARNRRAQYILSNTAPNLPGPGRWQRVR